MGRKGAGRVERAKVITRVEELGGAELVPRKLLNDLEMMSEDDRDAWGATSIFDVYIKKESLDDADKAFLKSYGENVERYEGYPLKWVYNDDTKELLLGIGTHDGMIGKYSKNPEKAEDFVCGWVDLSQQLRGAIGRQTIRETSDFSDRAMEGGGSHKIKIFLDRTTLGKGRVDNFNNRDWQQVDRKFRNTIAMLKRIGVNPKSTISMINWESKLEEARETLIPLGEWR